MAEYLLLRTATAAQGRALPEWAALPEWLQQLWTQGPDSAGRCPGTATLEWAAS